MSQKVKNNLAVISLLNNRLASLSPGCAEKVLDNLLFMYMKENAKTDIAETLKTIGYCCGKLENMTEKDGRALVKFLSEQYDSGDKSYSVVESVPELDEVDPFSELPKQN